MDLTVQDYARRAGLTERRVRALAQAGKLHARKLGRQWVIPAREVVAARAAVRPMTPANSLALSRWLEGAPASPKLAHRFRGMRNRMIHEGSPEALLRAWMAQRADQRWYSAQPEDLTDLRSDRRFQPSGISNSGAGLLSGGEAEGYASLSDLGGLMADYLLVEAAPLQGNVLLRVADLAGPVPAAYVAVDLLDRGGPREVAAARRLIRQVLAS